MSWLLYSSCICSRFIFWEHNSHSIDLHKNLQWSHFSVRYSSALSNRYSSDPLPAYSPLVCLSTHNFSRTETHAFTQRYFDLFHFSTFALRNDIPILPPPPTHVQILITLNTRPRSPPSHREAPPPPFSLLRSLLAHLYLLSFFPQEIFTESLLRTKYVKNQGMQRWTKIPFSLKAYNLVRETKVQNNHTL